MPTAHSHSTRFDPLSTLSYNGCDDAVKLFIFQGLVLLCESIDRLSFCWFSMSRSMLSSIFLENEACRLVALVCFLIMKHTVVMLVRFLIMGHVL
jgi:hypothetical protein